MGGNTKQPPLPDNGEEGVKMLKAPPPLMGEAGKGPLASEFITARARSASTVVTTAVLVLAPLA